MDAVGLSVALPDTTTLAAFVPAAVALILAPC